MAPNRAVQMFNSELPSTYLNTHCIKMVVSLNTKESDTDS
uniref:Uncharacterized protein n=1 Tax=Arundo donax TaxID=35708 RepID=A0A0A9HSA9_ARUDO